MYHSVLRSIDDQLHITGPGTGSEELLKREIPQFQASSLILACNTPVSARNLETWLSVLELCHSEVNDLCPWLHDY